MRIFRSLRAILPPQQGTICHALHFATWKRHGSDDSERKGMFLMTSSTPAVLPAATRIGHVHLKVADLDRAVRFYHDTLGFDLTARYGDRAAFLSAGGYHHHIGLNTWESKGGSAPAAGSTGLYHFAINYPERRDLSTALKRLYDHGWGIDGASDHGTHEAIYLHDPDFNGIELAWDRPRDQWPRRNGTITFSRNPLDFRGLLAELGETESERHLAGLSRYR
jgi:catechol 2,3-dioxygenase